MNPLLVQFAHPQLWVEAVTSFNNNGEAGTISANDYIKGYCTNNICDCENMS